MIRCMMLAAVLVAWLAGTALGDGKSYSGRTYSTLGALAEKEQRAVIAHHDGMETMVLAIDLNLQDDHRAVWIFPVRGRPEQVEIDLASALPVVRGRDFYADARGTIHAYATMAMATQIYPLLIEAIFLPSLGGSRSSFSSGKEIDRFGLKAETLAATSVEDLRAQLAARGTVLSERDLASFAAYTNTAHALVAVWIASRETVAKEFPKARSGRRSPCLVAKFPTERAFFPLKATAGGDDFIEAELFVMGYVAPRTGAPIRMRSRFLAPAGSPGELPAMLRAEDFAVGAPMTYVEFASRAKDFSDDIEFDPVTPRGVQAAQALAALTPDRLGTPGIFGVWALCVGVMSYVAAGLAGIILFRRWEPYARCGLLNLLSVPAMYYLLRRRWQGKAWGDTPCFLMSEFDWFMWVFSAIFTAMGIAMYACGSLF